MTQSLPPAAAVSLGVSELREQAERLGLTWGLRPATAQAPFSADPTLTPVILDGDTVAISAHSLIGMVPVTARVMVMFVPPSGNYVVGYAAKSPTEAVAGARATTTGFILTTSGTTESDIPELAIANASVAAGNLYSFLGNIVINGGGSATSFLFRWRKGTSLTGTLIASFVYLPNGTNFDDTKTFDASWRPTDTETDDYFLSVQRQAGASNINIYGTHATNLEQSHARLERIGTYTPGLSLFVDS